MRFQRSWKCLFCLLILSLSSEVAWGQSASSTSEAAKPGSAIPQKSDRDQFLSKISDLQAQIDALRKQIALGAQAGAGTPVTAVVPVEQAKGPLTANDGLGVNSETSSGSNPPGPVNVLGDHVRVGGYGSVRFEANNVAAGHFVPGGSANAFTFRRFVLTTEARFSDRLRIYTETEFERLLELEVERKVVSSAGGLQFEQGLEGTNGGAIELEQAWGQFDFSKNHGFRFGVVLTPVGRYNINHDDDYWDLPRRTLTDRDGPVLPVKTAWRELGAGLVGHGNVGGRGRIDYQVYVLGGATLDFALNQINQTGGSQPGRVVSEAEVGLTSGAFDGTKSAQAVSYRLAYSPRLGSEIALSGYHGKYTPGFLPVSEAVQVIGLDGNFKHKAFALEGEVIVSDFGNVRNVLAAFAERTFTSSLENSGNGGLRSEMEFSLEGLARRRYGFWTDVKYHWRPNFLKKTLLGRGFEDPVLIPIVRYELVWLKDLVTGLAFDRGILTELTQENRSQDRLTVGISYRPVASFAFQLAFEHNQRRSGSMLIYPEVPQKSTNGFLVGMSFGF
ncbi:MAG: hypothetical protein LAO31_05990 [Acidobacteriia bacterium]|nr:hypothetical protein [Terriglobia bacterium]